MFCTKSQRSKHNLTTFNFMIPAVSSMPLIIPIAQAKPPTNRVMRLERIPRVLAITAPMTQLNTPYPSTAYLTGFLREQGLPAVQTDLALALVLRLFSRAGLQAVLGQIQGLKVEKNVPPIVQFFIDNSEYYLRSIEPVIRFLQGQDPSLAHRIVTRSYLPEGPRFDSLENYVGEEGVDALAWAFGSLGLQDRARHLATLYLNDLADVVKAGIDSRFEFVRYAEQLAQSMASFDPLAQALSAPPSLLDRWIDELAADAFAQHSPDVVMLSVPFPGSVYAAFRIARVMKQRKLSIITILGGGFVNTELRELSEPRVFDDFDYVCLDAGERPLCALLEHHFGQRGVEDLRRTFLRTSAGVRYIDSQEADVPFAQIGTPTWDGLPINRYLSLLDMLNPMHRLWSDGRWNKLTVAHGCYWKKCSFCDVDLDYIGRYETAEARVLVDRIETIVAETGQSGFHFVDEAAPPKALRDVAHELIARERTISWWGNIRFEKSFTPQLCDLLAQSGCVAVSGGLEVASDRLLNLMQKGVSVAQVARVTRAFSDAGILVHAYLMYGFPTQTLQETVDALEYVRQLFEQGCIQSGFFHRFSCTVHSPVGKSPEKYGIRLHTLPEGTFARNDIGFTDPSGVDHAPLGRALSKALYNYMHGIGLDDDVRVWFEEALAESEPRSRRAGPNGQKGRNGRNAHNGRNARNGSKGHTDTSASRIVVPRSTVPRHFIARALSDER
jgi:hypothetical protein